MKAKKLLSLLLAAMMVIGCLPVSAMADGTTASKIEASTYNDGTNDYRTIDADGNAIALTQTDNHTVALPENTKVRYLAARGSEGTGDYYDGGHYLWVKITIDSAIEGYDKITHEDILYGINRTITKTQLETDNYVFYESIPIPQCDIDSGKAELTISYKNGNTEVFTETFTVTLPSSTTQACTENSPTITSSDNTVTITADSGCDIYYTTDGDEPTTESTKYTGSFSISADTTVKAIAVKDGYAPSSVASESVTYTAPSTEPSAKTITDSMVTLNRTSFTYNPGVTQKPTVTVKDGEITLTENTHYTLTWSSEDSIGVRSYTVTVNGIGDYTGSVQKTYEITSLVITDAMVTLDNTTLTYNGSEQKPEVTVSPFAGTTLNTNAHYDITWPADCTNAGEKTITIKGKEYISGTVTKTYEITKATLTASDYTAPTAKSGLTAGTSAQALITAGSINVSTTGGATAPEMQYKVGNDGVYSTTVPTATSAGTYTVYWKILGGTNYEDVAEQSFDVTIGEGSSTTPITYDAPEITGTTPFDGSTTVTITKTGNTVSDESAKIFYTTDGSTPDCESTEYTAPFTVSDTCTVKAIVHSFTSTAYDSSVVEKTFTKNALPPAATDISTATVTVDPNADLVYDGTAKKPALIVTVDGNTLNAGTDYTVTYFGDTTNAVKNVRYTVTGQGRYTGSKEGAFNIAKRPITVKALDQTITYGESIDRTKYEITSGSLVSGHKLLVELNESNGEIVIARAGVHPETETMESVDANYEITKVNGKLTVNPATTSATIAPSDYYVDENNDYTSTDLLTSTDKNTVTFKSGAVIPYCKPTDGASWAAGNYVWVKITLPTGLDLTNGIKVNDEKITYDELDDIGDTGSKNTLVLNTKIEKSHITAGKKELVVKWDENHIDTFTIVIPKGAKYEDSEGNTVGGSTNSGSTTTPSTPTDPTKPTVSTKTDAAGNTTTTTTWSDGKKSEVTVAANGDVTAIVTAADGSVIAEIDLPSTPETEKTFNDVKDGDWYKEAVETAAGLGILNGTSEKNFSPKVDMTRGMIVKALHNLCGGSTYGVGETTFKDTTGQYYNDPAEWAAKLGITNGSGNSDTFKPNDSVTREQLVTMLYRFAKAIGLDTSKTTSLDSFTDSEKVSDYAEEAMAWAVANGIINGRPSANGGEALSAKGTANRAEVAAILARFVVLFK